MENYVQHALTKFNHTPPDKSQHAPHAWNPPIYDCRVDQLPTRISKSPPLYAKVTHQIQSIEGTLLYYSDIYTRIKPALNEISSQQSAPTEDTNAKSTILLDYLSINPDDVVQYQVSNMLLVAKNDATYLVLPKSLSRTAA